MSDSRSSFKTQFAQTAPSKKPGIFTRPHSLSSRFETASKQIEGVWGCVSLQVNGKKSPDEVARRIMVVYRPDGSWTFHSKDGMQVNGTSTIDPTQKPKTIDFTPTDGEYQSRLFL